MNCCVCCGKELPQEWSSHICNDCLDKLEDDNGKQ